MRTKQACKRSAVVIVRNVESPYKLSKAERKAVLYCRLATAGAFVLFGFIILVSSFGG